MQGNRTSSCTGLAALAASFLLLACSPSKEEQAAAPAPPVVQNEPVASAPPVTASIALPSFVNLVKQQGPAVVNISAMRMAAPQSAMPQLRPGDPLFEFFRRFGGIPDTGEVPVSGLGSGFIRAMPFTPYIPAESTGIYSPRSCRASMQINR